MVSRLSADGSALRGLHLPGRQRQRRRWCRTTHFGVRQLPQNYGDALRGDILTDVDGQRVRGFGHQLAELSDRPAAASAPATRAAPATRVVVKLSQPWTRLHLGAATWAAPRPMRRTRCSSTPAATCTWRAARPARNFPATAGGYQPRRQGSVDGFVARIAADGQRRGTRYLPGHQRLRPGVFSCSWAPRAGCTLGQTLGAWPVSRGRVQQRGQPAVYSKAEPGPGPVLTAARCLAQRARATIDISPTAFLVDQCDRVYASGWGGDVNQQAYGYAGYVSQQRLHPRHAHHAQCRAHHPRYARPGLGLLPGPVRARPHRRCSYATYYGDPSP
ncbi:MAG: hypothetical protein WKG07_03535 [Hymenobacter sp.]